MMGEGECVRWKTRFEDANHFTPGSGWCSRRHGIGARALSQMSFHTSSSDSELLE